MQELGQIIAACPEYIVGIDNLKIGPVRYAIISHEGLVNIFPQQRTSYPVPRKEEVNEFA